MKFLSKAIVSVVSIPCLVINLANPAYAAPSPNPASTQVSLAPVAPPGPDIWTHYQGNAFAQGYVDEFINTPLVASISNAHPLTSLIHGSGAIVNGVLYVGDEIRTVSSACPSREYGRFVALNITTGQIIWQRGSCTDYVGMFAGQESVAYGQGKIFFADEGFTSADNAQLHAVNPSNGARLWTRNDLGYHISTSPLMTSSSVIIGADDTLYALNPSTGATLWTRAFPYGSFAREMALSVAGDAVYLLKYESSFGQRLHKVSTSTGQVLWSSAVLGNNVNVAYPTAHSGGVVVGSDNRFYNFSSSGQVLWSRQIAGGVDGGSALTSTLSSNAKVVVTWTSNSTFDVRLSSLDLATGNINFTTQIETYGSQLAAPIVVGTKAIVHTYFGHLKVVDLVTGVVSFSSGVLDVGGGRVTPMLYQGKVTVIGPNGYLNQFVF